MEKWIKEREFSLKISIIEGSISSISGAIIHQGFFLQSFIIFLNGPDFWISIIPNSQFIFSFLGILSGYYLTRFGERKKSAIITNTIYRGIFILPAVALLFFGRSHLTLTIFIISTLISFLFFRFLMVIWMRWMDLLVFEETRGRYLGIRKTFTTFFLLVGFLLGGYLIEIFTRMGKGEVAYFMLFLIVALIGVISSWLYSFQFDTKTKTRSINFRQFLSLALSSVKVKKLRGIIIFFALFEGVSAIGVPFIPVQILKGFGLSTEYLGIQFSIYAISMAISSYFWGVLLDKFGPRSVLQLSTLGLCFTISLWFFIPKELWFILSFFEPFISGVFSGGYESVFMYMIFSEVRPRFKDYFFSVVSAINGFTILIGSIMSGIVVLLFGDLNVFILYKDFKVYEFLFLLTLIGRVVTSMFLIPDINYKKNVKSAIDLLRVTFTKIFQG
ncbi:MAG: MFS transporter [Brevinematales bacterium]|nr:MFS transporter [Brevinematales bacterium]